MITEFKGKRLPIQMSLIRQFAIRNKLLYSGFVLPNVQIFFVQQISFATFGVSIDDFFYEIRWSGLQPMSCDLPSTRKRICTNASNKRPC